MFQERKAPYLGWNKPRPARLHLGHARRIPSNKIVVRRSDRNFEGSQK